MSENFSWDKHLTNDTPGGTPAPGAGNPQSAGQPGQGGAPQPQKPAGDPFGDPNPPKPVSKVEGDDFFTEINPQFLKEFSENSDSNLDFTPSAIKPASEQYVPAHVPEELRTPTISEGKYKVGAEGKPDYLQIDSSWPPVTGLHLDELLRLAFERKASDFHLSAGLPPMIRLDGELAALPYQPLTPQETQRLMYEVLSDDNITKFEGTHEIDCSYTVKDLARFRVNVYMQRGAVAAALRLIPTRIPSFDELKLPAICREMAKRTSGLILVTGPTGSGKSTTIAAMLDDINESRHDHIMTIEDPIEYLHQHKRCMVNQRELHSDTYSFHNALRAVLREDPDSILVGELRDLETIEAALTLAETGHLVFGTLHTRNAPATVDRIIDVFPSDQQDQIRVLLGNTIEAVVSQQLLPKIGGGRVAALEIMLGVPAIRNMIREGKTHQMYSTIETSQNVGMVTMDRSLADHYRNGMVSYEDCLMRAVDKDSFARLAKGVA